MIILIVIRKDFDIKIGNNIYPRLHVETVHTRSYNTPRKREQKQPRIVILYRELPAMVLRSCKQRVTKYKKDGLYD